MTRIEATIVWSIMGAALMSSQAMGQPSSPSDNLLQRPKGQLGLVPGYYPLYVLMNNPRVMEELSVSEEQKSRWKEIYKKWDTTWTADVKLIKDQHAKKLSELVQKKGEVDQETYDKLEMEVAKLEGEMMNKSTENSSSIDRQLTKLLSQEQRKRLEQIRLQAEGPAAFERQEIQEALGLAEEQITEIKQIQRGYEIQTRKAASLPRQKAETPRTKVETAETKKGELAIKEAKSRVAEVRVQTMKSIEKILTNGQRKAYLIRTGESFDFFGNDKTKDDTGQKVKNDKGESK